MKTDVTGVTCKCMTLRKRVGLAVKLQQQKHEDHALEEVRCCCKRCMQVVDLRISLSKATASVSRPPHMWQTIAGACNDTCNCSDPEPADTTWQVTEEEEEEEIHGSRRSMGPGSRRSLDTPKRASSHGLNVRDDEEVAAPQRTWRQRLPWYKPTEEEKRLKAEKKVQQVLPGCVHWPPPGL